MVSLPGPQPASNTFIPGSRSRLLIIVFARLDLAKGLSSSTNQLNQTGQGSDLLLEKNRHIILIIANKIIEPKIIYIKVFINLTYNLLSNTIYSNLNHF